MTTLQIMQAAKEAGKELINYSGEKRSAALVCMADALIKNTEKILIANQSDLKNAEGSVSKVMLDRLMLNDDRIVAMANGIKEVAALPDPLEGVIDTHTREDGLKISKVRSPFGVIAIIYESRPNVTSDAAALAIKSGNACILRCGKEAHQSALAITAALQEGLKLAKLPQNAVMLIEDTTRDSANTLMTATDYIDLLIPRGGKGLISACVQNATVPCIETGTGICHIYVDKNADFDMALNIIENAKTSRPSVCNAAEVCLVDKAIASEFIPLLQKRLENCAHPVQLRFDEYCARFANNPILAGEQDFDTEFLDYIMAVGAVDGVSGACEHIALHSTHHSEAIVTNDQSAADEFFRKVDSAAVYHNASTRFTDGGEFGLGCEMGISTQKLHARGPMGLKELTTYKYIIEGNGNIR